MLQFALNVGILNFIWGILTSWRIRQIPVCNWINPQMWTTEFHLRVYFCLFHKYFRHFMNETYQSENVNFDSKIRFASFMNRHSTECQRIKSGYTLQNSPLPPVQAFCNANMYEAVLYYIVRYNSKRTFSFQLPNGIRVDTVPLLSTFWKMLRKPNYHKGYRNLNRNAWYSWGAMFGYKPLKCNWLLCRCGESAVLLDFSLHMRFLLFGLPIERLFSSRCEKQLLFGKRDQAPHK